MTTPWGGLPATHQVEALTDPGPPPALPARAAAAPGPALLATLRHAAPVTAEREIAQDPGFGIRQLTDIGVASHRSRGERPQYRGDLHRLPARHPDRAGRPAAAGECRGAARVEHRARRPPNLALYASPIIEIGRYARSGDVAEHLDVLVVVADAVTGQAIADARTDIDRDRLHAALAQFEHVSGRPVRQPAHPDLADVLVRATETGTGHDHSVRP